MNQRLATLLRISFVILDLLVLNLVFIICQYVFREAIILNKEQYTYLWFFSNAAWVAASWATSIYQDTYIYSFEKFSRRTMTALCLPAGAGNALPVPLIRTPRYQGCS